MLQIVFQLQVMLHNHTHTKHVYTRNRESQMLLIASSDNYGRADDKCFNSSEGREG